MIVNGSGTAVLPPGEVVTGIPPSGLPIFVQLNIPVSLPVGAVAAVLKPTPPVAGIELQPLAPPLMSGGLTVPNVPPFRNTAES